MSMEGNTDSAWATRRSAMHPQLALHVFVAMLNMFTMGYDLCVMSSIFRDVSVGLRPHGFKNCHTDATCYDELLLISTAVIGAAVAGPISGILCGHFGRRGVMFGTSSLFVVGGIFLATAHEHSIALFYIGRLLEGFAIGGGGTAAYTLVSEVSPVSIRGTLLSCGEVSLALGCLLASLVTYGQGGAALVTEWRTSLWVGVAPAALQFILLFTTCESPRWLLEHGQVDAAQRAAHRLRLDLDEIQNSRLLVQEPIAQGGSCSTVQTHRWQLARVVLFTFACSLTFGNSIQFNGRTIWEELGSKEPLLDNVYESLVKLAGAAFVAPFADKLGRRPVLIFGTLFTILPMVVMSISGYLHDFTGSLVGLLIVIFAWDGAWGNLVFAVASEITPQPVADQAD